MCWLAVTEGAVALLMSNTRGPCSKFSALLPYIRSRIALSIKVCALIILNISSLLK